jgi:hypothetical protein
MEINISFSELEYFKKKRGILIIIKEMTMNLHPQIEPASTGSLLAYLGLAIDEAKLVRLLIQSKNMVRQLKAEKPFSDRLIYLNREIKYLEKKLAKVRCQANRN